MQYLIVQEGDTWVLRSGEDQVGDPFDTYDAALRALSALIGEQLAAQALAAQEDPAAAAADDGLLSEVWEGTLAVSELLPGGRDFSDCAWTWRDPGSSLVPLMLQTRTDYGHMGAELAGFAEELSLAGGTVLGNGRFYNNEVGLAFRDLLLDGRRFGVSVDPSEAVEAEWICTEYDEEDGWCLEGQTHFIAYEIAGVTGTPFPGFDAASIMLRDQPASVAASAVLQSIRAAVRAAASAPAVVHSAPPRAWFELPEPRPGVAFLDTLGDEFLVEQGDGSVACPLQITEQRQIFGHLARWGQCHVGYGSECVSPPESLAAYQHFHTGALLTAEGAELAVGALIVGADHALERLGLWEARDHYAHSGSGWADVRASNGELGVWVCGAVRPDVTDEQLRVLRSLSLSGDWRVPAGGRHLELIAGLAVNSPGFPIARESLRASGYELDAAPAQLRAGIKGGRLSSLTASGIVARCPECQKRAAAELARGRGSRPDDVARSLARLEAQVNKIERRTRGLLVVEAEAVRTRVAGASQEP